MTASPTSVARSNTDPSSVVGDSLAEPTDLVESIQRTMSEVLPLFELSDADFEQASMDFIRHHVDQLSSGVSHKPVGFMYGGTDEFIDPKTPMIHSGMSRPYFLDDPAAYTASFPYIREFYNQYSQTMPPEKAYVNAVVQGTNLGQIAYFESYFGDPNRIANITADLVVDEELPQLSIADLKRAAMCQERSGITHNALAIFGIPSKLQMGIQAVQNEDGTIDSGPHGFLTFENVDGATVLYDPTNPVVVRSTEGKIVNATASIYRVTDTQTPYTGILSERAIQSDGTVATTRSRPVSYTFTLEN